MSKLTDKFKALFIMIRPLDAFINSFIVMFAIFFISKVEDPGIIVISGFTWLLISFANSIIKEYYETVHLDLIFPGNILAKEIIAPAEAMAYYTYFTISAVLLSSFIGIYTLILTIFITLFNQFSTKRCRKNPYRFPFSRGIVAGLMLLFSAVEYSKSEIYLFPAALLCVFTYIITYTDYARYYEKLDNKLVKSLLSIIIPAFILLTTIPFSQRWYNLEYLIIITVTANATLVYVLWKVFKGYKDSNINQMVFIMKLNLIAILIAVYKGLNDKI